MKGICHIWSRGRLISPSLPVGDDWYLNLSSQKRPPGRNLGEHRLVRRSGTTSRGTVVLEFCLRMRRFPRTEILTIFIHVGSTKKKVLFIEFFFRVRLPHQEHIQVIMNLGIGNNTVHCSIYRKGVIINQFCCLVDFGRRKNSQE